MGMRSTTERKEKKTGGILLAAAAFLLAVAAGMTVIMAGFGTRLGLWHFVTGFSLLKLSIYVSGAALLTAIAGMVAAWRKRRWQGLLLALLAVAGSCLTAGVPLTWWLKAKRVPPIHDITTDTAQP